MYTHVLCVFFYYTPFCYIVHFTDYHELHYNHWLYNLLFTKYGTNQNKVK